jgi:plasmid stability protein
MPNNVDGITPNNSESDTRSPGRLLAIGGNPAYRSLRWEQDTRSFSQMTLNIDLADDQVAALTAKAQAQGVSAEQYARRVLEQDIQTVSRRRHISEVIRDNMRDVPPEDLAALPSDGASQHDHYIYGVPKRAQ